MVAVAISSTLPAIWPGVLLGTWPVPGQVTGSTIVVWKSEENRPIAAEEDTVLRATAVLPAAYERRGTLDAAHNRLAVAGLMVLGVAFLLTVTWLLILFLSFVRRREGPFAFTMGPLEVLLCFVVLGVLTAVVVLAHEAVHGLGFWAITRRRPVFGFRGLYAFAGAPGWYIPCGQYALVGRRPSSSSPAWGSAYCWSRPTRRCWRYSTSLPSMRPAPSATWLP